MRSGDQPRSILHSMVLSNAVDVRLTCDILSYMKQYTSQVSSKGQVVIPAELREEMDIEAGTKLVITREGNALVMRSIDALIESLCGVTKGAGAGEYREREHKKDRFEK